jgi:hypothetical protein
MFRKVRILATLVTVILVMSPGRALSIVVGQIDDFQTGTTMGWTHVSPNPPSVILNGGPGGAGDHALRKVSDTGGPGGQMFMFNIAQWTGDYVAAGVTQINAWMRVDPSSAGPLSMRIAVGRSGFAQASSTPIILPNDGVWRQVSFGLSPSDLDPIGSPTPLSFVLSNVTELRILSNPSISWQGEYIDATLDVDNITAGPEPATPPVADADGPYSVYVGDALTLDASGSTDEGEDIVSCMWDLDDNGSFETDAGGQAVFDVNFAYLQSLVLLVNHTYTIRLRVTDSEQQSDTADSTLTILPPPVIEVAVDIRPQSCPNPFNVKSKGVLPVAILGTEDVNVIDIDPTSIAFSFDDDRVGAIRCSYEDVAMPVPDSNGCNCMTNGPDGYLDLMLKFKTQEIVEALGEASHGEVLALTLTGVLFDETPIEGADCILVRGKFKPLNKADLNEKGVVDMVDFALFVEKWLESSVVVD